MYTLISGWFITVEGLEIRYEKVDNGNMAGRIDKVAKGEWEGYKRGKDKGDIDEMREGHVMEGKGRDRGI